MDLEATTVIGSFNNSLRNAQCAYLRKLHSWSYFNWLHRNNDTFETTTLLPARGLTVN